MVNITDKVTLLLVFLIVIIVGGAITVAIIWLHFKIISEISNEISDSEKFCVENGYESYFYQSGQYYCYKSDNLDNLVKRPFLPIVSHDGNFKIYWTGEINE